MRWIVSAKETKECLLYPELIKQEFKRNYYNIQELINAVYYNVKIIKSKLIGGDILIIQFINIKIHTTVSATLCWDVAPPIAPINCCHDNDNKKEKEL